MKIRPAPRVTGGRCAAPEGTLQRLEKALGSVCSYRYEEHRVSDTLFWGAFVSDALRLPPMGKGSSPLMCRISTLAEAVEWLALGRRRELAGHVVGQEGEVPGALKIADLLPHVSTVTPAALQAIRGTETARHWVDGFSLSRQRALKVPLEYVHALGGTNGLAAGNRIEEAIVHGTMEIFERRAAITVIKNRIVVPTIDTESIVSPLLRDQIRFLRDGGIEVSVKDFSFGGELPCVGAHFFNPALPAGCQARHVLKAGASFDREAALAGCFAEYAQVARLGETTGVGLREYERLLSNDSTDNFLPLFWFGYVPWRTVDFLLEGEVVPFERGERPGDCMEDIGRAGEICRRLGKDYLAVDLTDPRVGFPVAQVVIPGYSDIVPYHPASSPVLFKGWTRDLSMGVVRREDGSEAPCTAEGLFPGW
jgi:ribosomal protein S12 methylthiotransferase accessory factor